MSRLENNNNTNDCTGPTASKKIRLEETERGDSLQPYCSPTNNVGGNEEEKIVDHEILPFHKFSSENVLSVDPHSKIIAVSGTFSGSIELGVIVAEKIPLSRASIQNLLSSGTAEKKFQNDIYSQYILAGGRTGEVKVTTVYPATDDHLKKYGTQTRRLVLETPELYERVTKPFITKQSLSLDWVYNILEGKAEQERVIYQDPDSDTGFILVPDLKWDGRELDNLYVIAITRRRGIYSLRELGLEHVPMLRNILTKGKSEVCRRYGLEADQLRVYLHYQPSYYHLHVHFTHLHFNAPRVGVGEAHLLDDIIDNIAEIDPLYYSKKTLSFMVKESTAFYSQYWQNQKSVT